MNTAETRRLAHERFYFGEARELSESTTRTLRVTKLRRDPKGFWRANVSDGTATREFHDRYGSWLTDRRPRADAGWPPETVQADAPLAVARALTRAKRRAAKRRATIESEGA